MPSLTRRALVTLAALGPAAALAAPGSAATGSGPPPSPPEAEALLERAAYRGDLDVMLRKGAVRVLTAYSKTDFFVDRGESGGVTYEYMRAFEAFLRKRQGGRGAKVAVYFVPVSRDRLIPALLAGEGDLAAANLTVTPERRARVDFSEPYLEDVREVVVTGPASPELAEPYVMVGVNVVCAETDKEARRLFTSLQQAFLGMFRNRRSELPPPVDSMLPEIKVREGVSVREGGRIAFAVRKRSPRLKAALDAFVAKTGKGTTFGNIVFTRYLTDNDFVKDASGEAERRKFEAMLGLFGRFGERYGFDPLMLAAQGYQESRLDNSVHSQAGAIGIMQVLPLTAGDPNVDIADIEVLENNIHAAAKYMRFVMDTYFPEARMDPFDRTMFAFASYNAGPVRIAKLRRQAAGRGLDPDQWFGQVERVVAERVGRETVQYVSNILKYYVVYRRVAELQARKERALEAARTRPS